MLSSPETMFIPVSQEDMRQRGWDELDVIFVSGDAYIDHHSFGVPLLARWLEAHGFRVGIIAQPDWRTPAAFTVLGRPRLFFAVSAGAMDSMVAHYTPARKLRHDDAYTPGGRHGSRPNRATIVYTSRLKEAFKDVPVIIGGIEASLRRFAHYDFWENKLRRSILLDAKADLLIYGMAEQPLLDLTRRMAAGESLSAIRDIRGTCWISRDPAAPDAVTIPGFEEVCGDAAQFGEAFRLTYREQNPFCGRTVVQPHGNRLLVCAPPALPLPTQTMDAIYGLGFRKAPHPSYQEKIPAWEQIKNSITSHRGCYGGCAFCAITMHQGKLIQSRSEESILNEVDAMTRQRWFSGSISDIGGPTANMYGTCCGDETARATCRRESCIFPLVCRHLQTGDRAAVSLLKQVRNRKGIKHVVVSSGIRYDLMERQPEYFRELTGHHVGGLLKVAPEHLSDHVTNIMRKPGRASFEVFLKHFRDESRRLGKHQTVIPYLMSGHPGCSLADMLELALTLKRLGMRVEQVQDFTPTPGSLASCMYYTGRDPLSGKQLYVARSDREKGLQKALLLWHLPEERAKIREALGILGKLELLEELTGTTSRTPATEAARPQAGRSKPRSRFTNKKAR